jgi:hypothetical protein
MTMHFALPKESSDPIEIDTHRAWVINSLVLDWVQKSLGIATYDDLVITEGRGRI